MPAVHAHPRITRSAPTLTREQIERLRSLLGFGTVEDRRDLLDEFDRAADDLATGTGGPLDAAS